jgi:uncharacterized protein (TIGR03437 family)
MKLKVSFSRLPLLPATFLLISLTASAQTPTCSVLATGNPPLRAEGLTEQIATISLSCSGGTIGATITPGLFLTLNAKVTNPLDAGNNPLGMSATLGAGASPTPIVGFAPQLLNPTTLSLNGITYTAGALATQINISGILVSIGNPATSASGQTTVTALVAGTGVNVPGNVAQSVGTGQLSLLDSVINHVIPCAGSSLPTNSGFAFSDLITAQTAFSTLRVTESFAGAFAAKSGIQTNGMRILVTLSGYGNNAVVYVPDAIVGVTGSTPTSAGDYGTQTVSAGTYYPNLGNFLLARVNGPDNTGNGGADAFYAPTSPTTFSTVTQIPLTNGSGSVVYEVVDPGYLTKIETAQIPIFVAAPASSCPSTLNPVISASLAPVSTVNIPTQTDPVPRFITTTPPLDCTQIGDCTASYFPSLQVSTTTLTFTGSSAGPALTGSFVVGNGGSGVLSFTESISYINGSGWLSITGTTLNSTGNTTVNVSASPAALAPGAYQATITVNAGVWGSQSILVTFTVGLPAPVLSVTPTSTITLTSPSFGSSQQATINVSNTGAAPLSFTVSIAYQSGSGWLSASPTSGTNNTTVTLTANPSQLTAGTYQATVTINGGGGGTATVNVTFNVTAANPTIQSVVNSANLQAGVVTANSYATIFGVNLNDPNAQVTFNGIAATVIFDNATQINLLIPAALGSATSASVVATIRGTMSNTFTVSLAPNAPAVFNPGILNQNNSVNLSTQPARVGTYIQIFLTGLAVPVSGTVTVTIGAATLAPVYSGPSSINGLEQVNVFVPTTLPFSGGSAPLSVCIAGSCSIPVNLYLN